MRDAVGLLDQAASYSSERLDAGAVRQALGLADPMLVARLVDALLDGKVGDGLRECTAFVDAGGDPGQLVAELIDYWRALLLATSGPVRWTRLSTPRLSSMSRATRRGSLRRRSSAFSVR